MLSSLALSNLFHLQLGLADLERAPKSLLVLGIYIVHVLSFGLFTWRISKIRFKWPVAYSAYLTFGYAAFGFYVWAVGYFWALNRSFFISSTMVWGLFAIVVLIGTHCGTETVRAVLRAFRAHPVLTFLAAATILIAMISGTRGVAFDDDYRWQSAAVWAAAGHWVRSPFRLTNGPAMSEMLHVPAAVFGNLTAAHWASTGIWVCCALNAAAIARKLQISAVVGIVSVLSIPVFTSSGSILNSDVPAVAFATAAFVLLLDKEEPGMPPRVLLMAGVLLAAVLSAKFIVLGCLPGAIAVCVMGTRGTLQDRIVKVCILIAPIFVAGLLWMAHTYHLTGRPFDPTGKHLVRTPNDPMWHDGQAVGRIPSARDLLDLPLQPFMTIFWGQKEPFGGRTGLLWFALLPAALFLVMTKRVDSWMIQRRHLLLAVSFYILLAPIVLKTRFLMFFFIWMALFSATAYEHRHLLPRWAARTVACLFFITATVGIMDGGRKLLMKVIFDTPPAHPQHQVD
jgi:hypothetical protein